MMRSELSDRTISRRLEGGFTLVEVIVSLVLLAVGLLALAQVFSYSARASTGGVHAHDGSYSGVGSW